MHQANAHSLQAKETITSHERSILSRYALLTKECKVCINMLLDAAISYDAKDPTVLEMIAAATKMK